MKRYALLTLFFAFVLSDLLGVNLSLVTGLSAKNILLYALVVWIVLEAALGGAGNGVLERRYPYLPLHFAFFLLVLMAALSIFLVAVFHGYPGYSLMYAAEGVKSSLLDYYLVLFVFLAGVSSSHEARQLISAMTVMIGIACAISLIDMFGVWSLGVMTPRGDGRLQGPLGSSNSYGTLMALLIPITWAVANSRPGWQKIAWFGLLLVFILVLLFTVSRGAVAGLVAGSLLSAVLLRRHIRFEHFVRITLVAGLLAILGVVILAVQYGDLLYERFVATTFEATAYGRSSGRTQIWMEALRQMSDSRWAFVTGFGWRSFEVLNPLSAHSEYMEYLFTLGVLGLVLMLFLRLYVIRAVVSSLPRLRPDARIIPLGFLFGFISVMFANVVGNLYGVGLYVWAFAGLTLSLIREELAAGGVPSGADCAV